MSSFSELLAQGNAWLFIPSAIVLGALHGFEPGHSKTMMAAFIIAVRGTVMQAVLLGLSATFSHTILIWVLALVGLHYSKEIDVEKIEPWLQLFTGLVVIGMATWIFRRARREDKERQEHEAAHARFGAKPQEHHHDHHHSHAPSSLILPGNMATAMHEHRHGNGPHGGMMIDTGHGWLEVSVFEDGVPPRFRVYPCRASGELVPVSKGTVIAIETARLNGSTQKFIFEPKADCWEATAILPEPHEFLATVTMSHGDHAHNYRLHFMEDHAPAHEHLELLGNEPGTPEYQDAHERAHAEELQERFASRSVTTWQIVVFGLTGGLMPCPAAFTILLICLQLKQVALGMSIVLAFSVGLALTMVSVGALAALSVRAATSRFKGVGALARKMPFASAGLMAVIGLIITMQGVRGLWH